MRERLATAAAVLAGGVMICGAIIGVCELVSEIARLLGHPG